MERVSEGFSSIFDELNRLKDMAQGMANMVRLLEHELETERKERRRLQALVNQMRDHAQMIAEEGERGVPIVELNATGLLLIENGVRDDFSMKLAAVDTQAIATHSNPGAEVTPDWLVGAMPSNPTNKLENSYVLSSE